MLPIEEVRWITAHPSQVAIKSPATTVSHFWVNVICRSWVMSCRSVRNVEKQATPDKSLYRVAQKLHLLFRIHSHPTVF